jgi:hypothetical protein
LDPVTVEKIHILGTGYQKQLLEQVPAENLPKEFGGACDCEGGCQLSDMGPWQDPQWAKPPKWAKSSENDDATIEHKPGEIVENPAPDGSSNPPREAAGNAEEKMLSGAAAPNSSSQVVGMS